MSEDRRECTRKFLESLGYTVHLGGTLTEHVLVVLGPTGTPGRQAAQAGLRIHEVAKIEWSDIDLEGRELLVVGKGRKAAKVHMSAALITALQALPGRDGRVFRWRQERTLRGHLRKLCERAQVRYTKRHFHGLRHHCATRMHDETGDLMLTASHMRHSSTQTTETYAKGDRRKIAAIVNRWGEAAAS